MLPPVPSRSEPIGVALDVRGGRIEGAVVMPTVLLAAMVEFAANRAAGPGGEGAAPASDDGESAP